MKQIISGVLAMAAVVAFAPPVVAHEVTYRGTVVSQETGRYAQPSGGVREVRELHVTVVDAKTKKPSNRVFVIVDATKSCAARRPSCSPMRPSRRASRSPSPSTTTSLATRPSGSVSSSARKPGSPLKLSFATVTLVDNGRHCGGEEELVRY